MRVLLIPALNIVDCRLRPYVPYGLLSLQASSRSCHDTEVIVAGFPAEMQAQDFRQSNEVVESFIECTNFSGYDVFAISTICDSAHFSLDIARYLKKRYPHSIVVLGGPYVTKLSEEILKSFDFVDAIFVGESELSFPQAINSIKDINCGLANVAGLRTRSSNFVRANILADLDSLPYITDAPQYFDFIRKARFSQGNEFVVPLEATRGCPLQCSFCSTRQTWGASVRRKSALRLMDEMSIIEGQTGDRFFSLIGDNVGVPVRDFMKFCDDLIRLECSYEWAISLKLDWIEPYHLCKMWDAGCRGLFIGVESASQETLRRVNKGANLAKEVKAIETAIDIGFHVTTSLIIGFPWETESDIRETYQMHCKFLEKGAARSQVIILCPIPGTDIVQNEKIYFDGWNSNMIQDNLRLSSFHSELVQRHPNLFSHFGHYDTPNVSRRLLKSYRDAAAQFASLRYNVNAENRLAAVG